MTSSVTFRAVVRQGRGTSVGVMPCVQSGSFDPTATAVELTGIVLPKGAIIQSITTDGGATGGSSPTIDIGTVGNGDVYIDNAVADSVTYNVINTTEAKWTLTATTADTPVYGMKGASAATGGTVVVHVAYHVLVASAADPSGS